MKKILFSIIALLGVLSANADTTWDFTSVSDADYAALGNDAVNWAKDASVDRYGNATNLENAALMANGTELDFAKGILFTVSKNRHGSTDHQDAQENRENLFHTGTLLY